jgi:hypothetical protein
VHEVVDHQTRLDDRNAERGDQGDPPKPGQLADLRTHHADQEENDQRDVDAEVVDVVRVAVVLPGVLTALVTRWML